MPWNKGDYPPSYKKPAQKDKGESCRNSNEVLKTNGNEGEAIATGLKKQGYI